MRKVLISILILLLVLMTYYVIIKNITFLNWRSKSIGNIKTLNEEYNEIEKIRNGNVVGVTFRDFPFGANKR